MTTELCVERDTHESLDFDQILSQIGEFGKYQKILFWLVCLPACIPCGFCAFNQLFMADVPQHWCKVPYLMKVLPKDWKKIGIPLKTNSNDTYSSCSRFKINWEDVDTEDLKELIANQSWPTEVCLDGWEYEMAEGKTSIVVDFNLVCDWDLYPTLGLAFLNLGGPIGVYFFGALNDKIGRKYSFFICLSILVTGGILTGLVTGFWFWASSRFMVGLTVPAIYQIPFILSLELVGPKFRSFVTVFTCLFYTFGLIILSGITYLILDWRMLAFATSAPFISYFFYWIYLPESPRWLMVKGRYDEASQILENMAKINGRQLPENLKIKLKRLSLQKTKSDEKHFKKGPTISTLFSTPNMRLKTILITFNWFANEMVYVGLSYYGPSLGSNEHLSFFLSATIEIPSYLFCWLAMDWWGRRWPLCLCMITSGVCCIATVLLPPDSYGWTLGLYLVSKSTISASFLIIYPFAGELYPTQLRGIGIGTSAYIGGLGLIVIPFITYLGKDNLVLPLKILGVIAILGGITCLRLPETLHQKLPQTAEEGEDFGKFWKAEDCWRCVPAKPMADSYENLNDAIEMKSKLLIQASRIIKEGSNIETNLDPTSGTMQMTYWF